MYLEFHLDDAENDIVRFSDNAFNLNNEFDRGLRKFQRPSALNFEWIRRKTFHYFKKGENIDTNFLAELGYVYNRFYDSVFCSFCGKKISPKKDYEDATTHRTSTTCDIALNCDMNKLPLCGNVQITDDNDASLSYKIDKILNLLMRYKLEFTAPDQSFKFPLNPYFPKSLRYKTDFSQVEDRLATFQWWFLYLPPEDRPCIEMLASAGFICTGFTDLVVCFKCKGGLFNIHRKDDPFRDHCQFYSHCPFILRNALFLDLAIDLRKNVMRNYYNNKLSEEERVTIMRHPLVQKLREKFDEPDIQQKMVDYLLMHGCFPDDELVAEQVMKYGNIID